MIPVTKLLRIRRIDTTGCRRVFIEAGVYICPKENIENEGRVTKLAGWAACL